MMAVDLETAKQALHTLYQNPDPAQKKEAERWLAEVRAGDSGWSLGFALLHPSNTIEGQFFGAATLHKKINNSWDTLGDEHKSSLKGELIQALLAASSDPARKIVKTRLAVVLAAYALHAISDIWSDVVTDSIQIFEQSASVVGADAARSAALSFLAVLPQEYQSSNTTGARKHTLRIELFGGKDQVLSITGAIIADGGAALALRQQALECLDNWIEFGIPFTDLHGHMELLFAGLQDENLFEACGETLSVIGSHPSGEKYPKTVLAMIPRILALAPRFHAAVKEEDEEQAKVISKLVVSLFQKHNTFLMKESLGNPEVLSLVMGLLSFMLEALGYPRQYPTGETLSETTIYAWYLFVDEIGSADIETFPRYFEAFGAFLPRLLETIFRKCHFPPEDQPLGKDDTSDFLEYRNGLSEDLVLTLFTVLKDSCVELCHQLLSQSLERRQWQSIEAALFCIKSFAEMIEPDEEKYVPVILGQLAQIDQRDVTIVPLSCTNLLVLGGFSGWLDEHPQYLEKLAPIILQGLSVSDLSSSAVSALLSVCSSPGCSHHLLAWITDISRHCTSIVQSRVLQPKENENIVRCLGQLITEHPNGDDCLGHITPLSTYIVALITENAQKPGPESLELLRQGLQLLHAYCGNVDPKMVEAEHPVATILQNSWSAIAVALSTRYKESAITEGVWKATKSALGISGEALVRYLPDILETLQASYEKTLGNAEVEMLTQVVVLYGRRPEMSDLLTSMIFRLSSTTFGVFQTAHRDRPDVVYNYFTMLMKLIRRFTVLVLGNETLAELVFEWAVKSLTLTESPAVKAATLTLKYYIDQANPEGGRSIVLKHGKMLVQCIIEGISGRAPSTVHPFLSDVLLELKKTSLDEVRQWLTELLTQPNYPTPTLDDATKQLFISNVVHQRHAKAMRVKVKEFSILARGLQNTAFGAL